MDGNPDLQDTILVKKMLVDAKNLILTEDCWARGMYAVGMDGQACPVTEACKYCATGALWRAGDELGVLLHHRNHEIAYEILMEGFYSSVNVNEDFSSVEDYNDCKDTTHAMVLAAYDKAIEIAEKM